MSSIVTDFRPSGFKVASLRIRHCSDGGQRCHLGFGPLPNARRRQERARTPSWNAPPPKGTGAGCDYPCLQRRPEFPRQRVGRGLARMLSRRPGQPGCGSSSGRNGRTRKLSCGSPDIDENRLTVCATNTSRCQRADLEFRHHRRVRCKDQSCKAKDSRMRNLPLEDFAQNRIWVVVDALATELTAWMQMVLAARRPEVGTETATLAAVVSRRVHRPQIPTG